MAYTTKRYVDYDGIELFKQNLDNQIGDNIEDALSLALEDLSASFSYDITGAKPLLKSGTSTIMTVETSAVQNNKNPITSGAVYTILGDIETLLAAI